ncbi:MAG: hypothetical protein GY765_31075 [bacterium]|nr:hypothetical protein [bacterium]
MENPNTRSYKDVDRRGQRRETDFKRNVFNRVAENPDIPIKDISINK